jgi:adenylosuccinate lyase
VPFSHTLITLKSIAKGNNKLLLNEDKLNQDLTSNWAVVAEAIQNILRREAYPQPYEKLKDLTRGKSNIGAEDIKTFIQSLDVSDNIKEEMMQITPLNYVGYTIE